MVELKRKLLDKRWIVPAAGAAVAYLVYRRHGSTSFLENIHRYSAPNAALYDALTAAALAGFFARVAEELLQLAPTGHGHVLEIGSGPGRLAVKLAEVAPGMRVTGVDITPEMVERATLLASAHGVASRVNFSVADVAALPFPDASFDAAVSSLSLHHWSEQGRGIAEIHRVLRPGGVARIYDIVGSITSLEGRGLDIERLIESSPFGNSGGYALRNAVRLGPIPLIYRAELRRG